MLTHVSLMLIPTMQMGVYVKNLVMKFPLKVLIVSHSKKGAKEKKKENKRNKPTYKYHIRKIILYQPP